MQIVDDGLRLNLEGAHQVVERLAEELQASQVFQIAQVLALIDKAAPRQRKDIFQMTADGQKRRRIEGKRNPIEAKEDSARWEWDGEALIFPVVNDSWLP